MEHKEGFSLISLSVWALLSFQSRYSGGWKQKRLFLLRVTIFSSEFSLSFWPMISAEKHNFLHWKILKEDTTWHSFLPAHETCKRCGKTTQNSAWYPRCNSKLKLKSFGLLSIQRSSQLPPSTCSSRFTINKERQPRKQICTFMRYLFAYLWNILELGWTGAFPLQIIFSLQEVWVRFQVNLRKGEWKCFSCCLFFWQNNKKSEGTTWLWTAHVTHRYFLLNLEKVKPSKILSNLVNLVF